MIAAYRRTHSPSQVAWSEGRRPLGAVLHSPDEPSELLQWPGHDDSTINIVVVIIIIIIIIITGISHTDRQIYRQTDRQTGLVKQYHTLHAHAYAIRNRWWIAIPCSAASVDASKVAEKAQTGEGWIVQLYLYVACHFTDCLKHTQLAHVHRGDVPWRVAIQAYTHKLFQWPLFQVNRLSQLPPWSSVSIFVPMLCILSNLQ